MKAIPPALLAAALFVAGSVGTAALLAPASAQQQPAAQDNAAPSVAVIDVDRLFNESALGKSIDEQVRTSREQFEVQIRPLQAEADQLQQQLREVGGDTAAARDARKQLAVKVATAQALGQAYEAERSRVLNNGNLRMIVSIKEAAAKVAQQRGIATVLRKSPPVPTSVDTTNEQQVRQAQGVLANQTVLFASPAADITSAVLTQLDETFRASGGQPAGDAAAPAAP